MTILKASTYIVEISAGFIGSTVEKGPTLSAVTIAQRRLGDCTFTGTRLEQLARVPRVDGMNEMQWLPLCGLGR
jgi:hypothetical protein